MAETKKFQKFVSEWPSKKVGVQVDIGEVKYPISMYVDQFDDVCEATYAELAK